MSDQGRSSSSLNGNGDRRGKQRKYPVDEGKRPSKNQKWEPQELSFPSALNGLTMEDLNVFGMVSEQEGVKGLSDFMKQQQLAFQQLEQKNNIYSMINTSCALSQIGSEQDTKNKNGLDEYDDTPVADVHDDFNYGPPDRLICELQISESERLVIPSHMVYNEFPVLIHKSIPEDIFQLTDSLGREWEVNVRYNRKIHAYIFAEGWSLYLEHYGLKPPDWVRLYNPHQKLHFNHFSIQHEKKSEDCTTMIPIKPILPIPANIPVTASSQIGIKPLCLFQVVVTRSNRLRIFFDRAVGHLNPPLAQPPPNHLREYTIYLTDHLGQTWEMRYLRFQDEEAYIVVRGWEQYMAKHGLRHGDTIKFCWKHSKDRSSFLTIHERPNQQSFTQLLLDDKLTFPQFLEDNIMCELCLSKADVKFGRLVMPDVKIPFLCRGREIVKLVDQNNKYWYLIIVHVEKGYMLIDGWEAYVSEFELEAGDMVKIYMPACSDHDKHFLIQCQKKTKKKTAEENKEGERGSDKSGDGAGFSRDGSSK